MSKKLFDIQKEIRYTKLDIGMLERTDCTDEENQAYLQMLQNGQPLPKDIFQHETPGGDKLDEFYRLYDSKPTEAEVQEYLALKQYQELSTIRRCVVILTVIAVIASALGLWILYCLANR